MAKKLAYWMATGLAAFGFAVGGAADMARAPGVLAAMTHLGYPPYFATILGVWKVLAAVAVLVPRLPRLKEWAYAGMFFDLTGAVASHAAMGDSGETMLVPLALLAIVIASWVLRPASRTLAGFASLAGACRDVEHAARTGEAA